MWCLVKTPCGAGYCSGHQECVKEQYCTVQKGYGRRLMKGGVAIANSDATAISKDGGVAVAKANSLAVSGGGLAVANSNAVAISVDNGQYGKPYYEPCHYCDKHEKLECWDDYKCVEKGMKLTIFESDWILFAAPCQDVIVKKCVKEHLRPGYDVCHGGYQFNWYGNYGYGSQCGDYTCGYGEKCAEVVIQTCNTKCGDYDCGYGYECGYDDDCTEYAYLDTVCKDYYEPTCVALGYYASEYYKPSCKLVYKCDDHYDTVCGNSYCGYGYKCVLEKKDCYGQYYPDNQYYQGPEYHGYNSYEPEYHDGYQPEYHGGYEPEYHDGYEPEYHDGYQPNYYGGDGAASSTHATADGYKGAKVDTKTYAKGHSEAAAFGLAATDDSAAAGASYSGDYQADTAGIALGHNAESTNSAKYDH